MQFTQIFEKSKEIYKYFTDTGEGRCDTRGVVNVLQGSGSVNYPP